MESVSNRHLRLVSLFGLDAPWWRCARDVRRRRRPSRARRPPSHEVVARSLHRASRLPTPAGRSGTSPRERWDDRLGRRSEWRVGASPQSRAGQLEGSRGKLATGDARDVAVRNGRADVHAAQCRVDAPGPSVVNLVVPSIGGFHLHQFFHRADCTQEGRRDPAPVKIPRRRDDFTNGVWSAEGSHGQLRRRCPGDGWSSAVLPSRDETLDGVSSRRG